MDFAPAGIKVLSTWYWEYFELFTFHAFYMLFKFFRDDTNLTVSAQVLHIVGEHL